MQTLLVGSEVSRDLWMRRLRALGGKEGEPPGRREDGGAEASVRSRARLSQEDLVDNHRVLLERTVAITPQITCVHALRGPQVSTLPAWCDVCPA